MSNSSSNSNDSPLSALEMIQRYGIFGAGFLLIFASFLYVFNIGLDQGWIAPWVLIFVGLAVGAASFVFAFGSFRKNRKILAEIVGGFGVAVLFASLTYARLIGYWDDVTVMVALIAVTAWATFVNWKFDLRILTSIAFAGGLFAPFVVHFTAGLIVTLFVYSFVLNAILLLLSIAKKWGELPYVGLFLTGMLYLTYYLVIRPIGWWEPLAYLTAFFLLYAVVLLDLARRRKGFDQGTLFLLAVNVGVYAFWSFYLFFTFGLDASACALLLAFVFVALGVAIYRFVPGAQAVSFVGLTIGVVLLAVAGGAWGRTILNPSWEFVVQTYVWTAISAALVVTGFRWNKPFVLYAGLAGWILTFVFWFSKAWNEVPVQWFGVTYVPFLNPPALAWIALIVVGFVSAGRLNVVRERESDVRHKTTMQTFSAAISVLGHLAVGGLLTLQILYLWKYYELDAWAKPQLFYSLAWGIYALVLFFWGYRQRSKPYIYIADVVVVIVLAKVLLLDMAGQPSLITAITIFSTGIVFLGIGYLNLRLTAKAKGSS